MHCHMQNVIRMGPRVRLKMVRLQRARDRGRSGSESTRNKCTEIVSLLHDSGLLALYWRGKLLWSSSA